MSPHRMPQAHQHSQALQLLCHCNCKEYALAVLRYCNDIDRIGQNHIYTVYTQYFWQENHQIYSIYIQFRPTLDIEVR